jgi:hypothetical protein
MHRRHTALAVAAAFAALGAGCASNEARPTEELTRARTLVDQAERTGARQFASAELQSARDKLRRADAAAEEEEHAVARRLAVEASLDAELAAVKSRSGQAEAAAEEVAASVATLRDEAARGYGAAPAPAPSPTPASPNTPPNAPEPNKEQQP